MPTWIDWEKQDLLTMKLKDEHDNNCIACPQCSGQWFEQVRVQRFVLDHHVVLGQEVPPRPGSMPYVMLRCAHCGNMLEPRVVHVVRDVGGDDYGNMLDTLEGKFDKRKTLNEETNSTDVISSQKL